MARAVIGEFAILESAAQEQLISETPPLPGLTFRLMLSIQPSFRNYISWTLFDSIAASEGIVRRTLWNRTFDGQRFTNPLLGLKHGWHTTPTISSQLATATSTELQELLLSNASLVPPPNYRGMVIDGVTWFLKWRGMFGNQLVSWNVLYDEQKQVGTWTRQLADVLEQFFTRN